MGVKGFATTPNEMADKVKLLFNCIFLIMIQIWFGLIISVIKNPTKVLVDLD